MNQLTIEQRLEDYQQVLNWFNANEGNCQGLCILLGGIRWKLYSKAPFIGWEDSWEYYPEFKGIERPYHQLYKMHSGTEIDTPGKVLLRKIRISILEKAIELIK